MRLSAILSGGALISVVHSYAHYSDPSFKASLRSSLERRKGKSGGVTTGGVTISGGEDGGGGGRGGGGGGGGTPGVLIGDLVA